MKFVRCFVICALFCGVVLAKSITQKAGDKLQIAIPITAALYSLWQKDYEGIGQEALSILVTQGITEGLKRITQEKRPGYKLGDAKHSFPSGHAAGAFSGASYIHKRYSLKEATPFYVAATFVAYSRVDARRHWTHDVIAGAALATAVSFWLVDKHVSVEPTARGGVMLSYRREF